MPTLGFHGEIHLVGDREDSLWELHRGGRDLLCCGEKVTNRKKIDEARMNERRKLRECGYASPAKTRGTSRVEPSELQEMNEDPSSVTNNYNTNAALMRKK